MNYDLILHVDSDDDAIFNLLMSNLNNYLNAMGDRKFELSVVANGPGVGLFVMTSQTPGREDFYERVKPLMARGVQFKICANALAAHGISPESLFPGCDVVPAGLVEIVRLQREGFAYIKP